MAKAQDTGKSSGLANEKETLTMRVEHLDAKSIDSKSLDSKSAEVRVENLVVSEKETGKNVSSARDLVTEILLVEDDPTQNPWTFRMWFIGIGMSVFAGYVLTLLQILGEAEFIE